MKVSKRCVLVRRDEEHVARPKRSSFVAVEELAAARDDEVDLVARVGLLRIGAARRVDLDLERAVLEDRRVALAAGPGSFVHRLGNADPPASPRTMRLLLGSTCRVG